MPTRPRQSKGLASSPMPRHSILFQKGQANRFGFVRPFAFLRASSFKKRLRNGDVPTGLRGETCFIFSCAAHASPFHPQGRHASCQARGRPALEVPLGRSCSDPAPCSNALQAHRAKAVAAPCFKCRKHSGRRKARVFICGDHRIRLFYERCIIGPAQQHCNKRNPAFRKLRKKRLLPA